MDAIHGIAVFLSVRKSSSAVFQEVVTTCTNFDTPFTCTDSCRNSDRFPNLVDTSLIWGTNKIGWKIAKKTYIETRQKIEIL